MYVIEGQGGDGGRRLVRGRAAPRSISVLGATGSVGKTTLELIARHPDRFEVVALTAQSRAEELAASARRVGARLAVIGEESALGRLRECLAGSGIEAAAGRSGLLEAAARPADCIMAAIVGAAGLEPTLTAVRQGRRVALANKECLVSAGNIFMRAVARHECELLPVDSEHSAAFQVLAATDPASVARLVLTASGGPFRTCPSDVIEAATPAQALKHPNWSMGAKISIDSATLMNKGLELIEAFHLFGLAPSRLGVVVHPQSIVHCLVEMTDGSQVAQLALPDMATPIAQALGWPERLSDTGARLDLATIGQLTFEAPDETRFPALRLAREALTAGGSAPTVLNAANEVAVEAFLAGRLPFGGIWRVVADVLEGRAPGRTGAEPSELAEILAIDAEARRSARMLLDRRGG
jgi:1-deoxy-D-xylulose-5-phosphate reductoisomerase